MSAAYIWVPESGECRATAGRYERGPECDVDAVILWQSGSGV